MLNLIGWTELSDILDLQDEAYDENYISGILQRSIRTYKERPGFFKPYDNRLEFLGGLLAPIWNPLGFAVASAFMAFTAVIAACYFVGYLLFGLFSIITMNVAYRNTALEGVTNGLALMGLTLLGTAVGALLTALSIPHSITSLFTRCGATLVSEIKEYQAEQRSFSL